MVVAKKYILVNSFHGTPKRSDVEIVEEELPPIRDGEFLAEALYLSVDPYQRPYMARLGAPPRDFIGGQVAKVIESKHAEYPVDTIVMGHFGWRTHTIVDPSLADKYPQQPHLYRLPDFGGLPASLGLGVLGRVGNTAYFGVKEICRPKSGETMVVTGAAGAVGSHVGQIAKILGCKVIGFAGSEEKCLWLTEDLGFDFAFNYKDTDIGKALTVAAPKGVDCFFDNVGGEISSIIISKMNPFGRIAVCGAIASYNDLEKPKAPILQPDMVSKQLTMEGFVVNRFAARSHEGILQNLEWVREGRLKYREHVTHGFECAFDAFLGLFVGANVGKTLVKV